uniref:Uncharacterized protein n=1 Tax=Oryza brachyantha TaxID=4533 RepID=J3LCN9_ORYBR
MFIINVNGRSLSMEQSVFEAHMESARLGNHISVAISTSSQGLGTSTTGLNEESGVTEDTAKSTFWFQISHIQP